MTPRLLLLALFGLAGIPLAVGVYVPAAGQIGVLATVLIVAVALVEGPALDPFLYAVF